MLRNSKELVYVIYCRPNPAYHKATIVVVSRGQTPLPHSRTSDHARLPSQYESQDISIHHSQPPCLTSVCAALLFFNGGQNCLSETVTGCISPLLDASKKTTAQQDTPSHIVACQSPDFRDRVRCSTHASASCTNSNGKRSSNSLPRRAQQPAMITKEHQFTESIYCPFFLIITPEVAYTCKQQTTTTTQASQTRLVNKCQRIQLKQTVIFLQYK